jgi:hypothetical protein
MIRAEQETIREAMSSPGYIRPTIPGLRLATHADIGESQYVTDDSAEVIRIASERLTYCHRIDHSPVVDDWALEELDFAVRHIERLGPYHVQALGKMRLWAEYEELKEYEDIEPLPRLEEMWG